MIGTVTTRRHGHRAGKRRLKTAELLVRPVISPRGRSRRHKVEGTDARRPGLASDGRLCRRRSGDLVAQGVERLGHITRHHQLGVLQTEDVSLAGFVLLKVDTVTVDYLLESTD